MSTKKPRTYENNFKAKVVLEALKNDKTINQIASENNIIPENIKNWKKQFLENMEMVFDKDKGLDPYKKKISEKDELIEELYKQVGRITTHLEWAKKKSKEAGIEL